MPSCEPAAPGEPYPSNLLHLCPFSTPAALKALTRIAAVAWPCRAKLAIVSACFTQNTGSWSHIGFTVIDGLCCSRLMFVCVWTRDQCTGGQKDLVREWTAYHVGQWPGWRGQESCGQHQEVEDHLKTKASTFSPAPLPHPSITQTHPALLSSPGLAPSPRPPSPDINLWRFSNIFPVLPPRPCQVFVFQCCFSVGLSFGNQVNRLELYIPFSQGKEFKYKIYTHYISIRLK